MNTLKNICNSTLLATTVFWMILGSDQFNLDDISFVLLSMIPIFICCAVTISFTICPLFSWFVSEHFDRKQVFKTFFPVYNIVVFEICVALIVACRFENFSIAFSAAAFVSTSQSWIWMTKDINN